MESFSAGKVSLAREVSLETEFRFSFPCVRVAFGARNCKVYLNRDLESAGTIAFVQKRNKLCEKFRLYVEIISGIFINFEQFYLFFRNGRKMHYEKFIKKGLIKIEILQLFPYKEIANQDFIRYLKNPYRVKLLEIFATKTFHYNYKRESRE